MVNLYRAVERVFARHHETQRMADPPGVGWLTPSSLGETYR
jgi:hypothetical protein